MKGKALKYGDNINTDIISPPQYMELGVEEAAQHAMEAVDPGFACRVRRGDILVAGANFGSGSSRETSPLALKYLGVGAITAKFFARIFFRNAINVGLPVVECAGTDCIQEGDEIEILLEDGVIINHSKGEQYPCTPLPAHIMEIIRKGGLKNMLAEQYGTTRQEEVKK